MTTQKFTPPPFATSPQAPPQTQNVSQAPPQTQNVSQAPPQTQNVSQAPPQAQVPPQTQPQAQAAPQTKKSTPMTPDNIKYIIGNVKTMGYTEIANNLGITKHQVNRVLQEVKTNLRAFAVKQAGGDASKAYVIKENGKPDWSQPISETSKKVENKITTQLSRPAETRPGAGRGSGVVKVAINDEVEAILNSL